MLEGCSFDARGGAEAPYAPEAKSLRSARRVGHLGGRARERAGAGVDRAVAAVRVRGGRSGRRRFADRRGQEKQIRRTAVDGALLQDVLDRSSAAAPLAVAHARDVPEEMRRLLSRRRAVERHRFAEPARCEHSHRTAPELVAYGELPDVRAVRVLRSRAEERVRSVRLVCGSRLGSCREEHGREEKSEAGQKGPGVQSHGRRL